MKVAYSGGEQEVNIGDRFQFASGDPWEIVRHTGEGMYSPSGFGGTPTFACKCLADQIPTQYRQYVEPDGTVEFCGDSIASAMAGRYGGKRLGMGEEVR